MKTKTILCLGVLALLAFSSVARAERPLDGPDYKLSLPDGWVEAKDMAASALQATIAGGGVEATTVAFRHTSKQLAVLGIFMRSKVQASSDIRTELGNFHNGMKKELEKGGATFTKFELSEGHTRLTSTFEGNQGAVRMKGVAVAAVQTDGRLLGWSVLCIYTSDLDGAVCSQVLSTFAVVHPDRDLRPVKSPSPVLSK